MTPTLRLPAVAALTAALLTVGACGSGSGTDDKDTADPSTAPAAQPIDYEKDGGEPIRMSKAADVSKLEGAPDDFKQFIAGVVAHATEVPDEECPAEVLVKAIHPDGYASGALVSCGGAAYMWAKRDGVWQQIWAGQDHPGCDDMKKFTVPVEIAGDKCFDGKDVVDYEA